MRKEAYFSPASIDATAQELLQSCLGLRSRHDRVHLIPGVSALLVLDVQAYFFNESSHAYIPSSCAILPRIVDLVARYSERALPVIYTRHVNTPHDAQQMATWWRDLIAPDSPLSRLVPELDPRQGKVLAKSQYDAFYQTHLEVLLREKGVRQVVICGVMTHLCCETTARSAFMRGFDVFFTVDGTASYTRAFHEASLLNLSHGFAVPMLVGEVAAALQRQDER
jgi:isochorismate hydrolase